MINLGIDFGSTYTLVSVYKHNTKAVEALALDQGTPCIPSVVSYDEYSQRYEFGKGAKSQTGRKGVKIFKAFKMLLTDKEGSKRLEERGFDSENTPEKISAIYLEELLRKVLTDL
ncbi:MAG: Hsp70 family protein, partial [Acutalibacteraceae bacterium]|nr:Hsp70 family protein [Acutalibacteraceae bacterium]